MIGNNIISNKKEDPTPAIGNDKIEPRSCGYCSHQRSCGAYWLMKKMTNEFHKEFGSWIRFPFNLTSLALKCKEFDDKRKTIKPDEN